MSSLVKKQTIIFTVIVGRIQLVGKEKKNKNCSSDGNCPRCLGSVCMCWVEPTPSQDFIEKIKTISISSKAMPSRRLK